jgi:hypothetical protein
MSDIRKDESTTPDFDIRIERVNTDKTRKDSGSDTVYHVYFELSGHPPPEWRAIFTREWKALSPIEPAGVDGRFLVLHCQLHEVETIQLPALKKAVAVTNEKYRGYVQKEAGALERREEVRKQERDDVDAMAAPLHFT